MTQRSFRGLFWVLALLGATLDQATKYGIFHWLYNDGHGGQHEVWTGKFELITHFAERADGTAVPQVNHGALFGLGSEYRMLANAVFAVVSVMAAVAIIYWSGRKSTAHDWSLCSALGLILAGTVGNLYDRLVFGGVRDFLHWYGWFEWPVFNVADCCLVGGAALLLLQAFWGRAEATQPAAAQPALRGEVAEV